MTELERGIAAVRDGDRELGCELLAKWLSSHPDEPDVYELLGSALVSLDRAEDALEALHIGVSNNPDDAPLRGSLGTLLLQSGRFEDAVEQLRIAVSLDPLKVGAWANLCAALRALGQLAEAEVAGRRATKINPEFAEGWVNLGNTLKDRSKHEESLAAFARVANIDSLVRLARSNSLLGRCYTESKPDALAAAHREMGDMLEGSFPERPFANPQEHPKIRIGYVSGDFRLHSVIYFFGTLLNAHDRSKFEIFLYSDVQTPDALTVRAAQAATQFTNCSQLSDEELWTKIRTDNIDVLVDLSGHTGRRLPVFALRAAPTQITWLGYPFTTGLRTMDYRITDNIADPAGSDEHYSERLLRLQGPFLCYQPPNNAPPVAQAPVSKNGYLTFGSFNHLAKISDETVVLFSALLQACENSKLLLKCKSLTDAATAKATVDRFMQYGLAANRLIVRGHVGDPVQHLATYADVDIALDPFPYNGTTTTLEALWMGVPVLTMRGHWHASRVGASLMSHLGLNTLVAENPDSLLILARELAKQPEPIVELRPVLRQTLSKSLLCDQARFARDFENAIVTAHEESRARFRAATT